MGSPKQKISIYDYPEHLNPFSENHTVSQDKRKIFVDKLRKTGNWPTKVSKRLSRSISWLEKSWLDVDEQHSRNNLESKIYNAHRTKNENENELSIKCENTDLDSSGKFDKLTNQSQDEENGYNENESIKEFQKTETTKRKKRRAPLPPNVHLNSVIETAETIEGNENTHSEDVSSLSSRESVKICDDITTENLTIEDNNLSIESETHELSTLSNNEVEATLKENERELASVENNEINCKLINQIKLEEEKPIKEQTISNLNDSPSTQNEAQLLNNKIIPKLVNEEIKLEEKKEELTNNLNNYCNTSSSAQNEAQLFSEDSKTTLKLENEVEYKEGEKETAMINNSNKLDDFENEVTDQNITSKCNNSIINEENVSDENVQISAQNQFIDC